MSDSSRRDKPAAAAAEPERQRAYWDGNLDPGNLGRDDEPLDFPREKRFFLASPDLRHALRELGDLRGLSIADIGGGLGTASAIFAERGAGRVVLADLAPRRVESAGRLMRELGFEDRFEGVAAPAEKLPWEDGSLDRVFTRSVLIHADLDAALAEIRRVLKPGGRAVFVEPLAANPFANLYRRFLGPSEWRSLTRYFTQERVERVGEAFGNLSEKRFYFFGFGAFAFQFALSSPALFRLALAGAAPLDAALLRVLPAAWRRAWFVVLSVRKEA